MQQKSLALVGLLTYTLWIFTNVISNIIQQVPDDQAKQLMRTENKFPVALRERPDLIIFPND